MPESFIQTVEEIIDDTSDESVAAEEVPDEEGGEAPIEEESSDESTSEEIEYEDDFPDPEETPEYLKKKIGPAIAPGKALINAQNSLRLSGIDIQLDRDDIEVIEESDISEDAPTHDEVVIGALTSVSLAMQISEQILSNELPEDVHTTTDLRTLSAALHRAHEMGIRMSRHKNYSRVLNAQIGRTLTSMEGKYKSDAGESNDKLTGRMLLQIKQSEEKIQEVLG